MLKVNFHAQGALPVGALIISDGPSRIEYSISTIAGLPYLFAAKEGYTWRSRTLGAEIPVRPSTLMFVVADLSDHWVLLVDGKMTMMSLFTGAIVGFRFVSRVKEDT